MKNTASRRFLFLLACVLLAMALVTPHPVLAQFYDDTSEDDNLMGQQDQYSESTDGTGFAPGEEDFTDGNQYVDESQLPPAEQMLTEGGRSAQIRLQGDKQTLPLNAAWGAGTGLLIGGWFALIGEGNNRETQRSIGMGIVLGTLLGVAVGLRSVINPSTPRAASLDTPPNGKGSTFTPLVSLDTTAPRVGFRLTF